MIRQVIINSVIGFAWAMLLHNLGATVITPEFYFGIGLMGALIINSMIGPRS